MYTKVDSTMTIGDLIAGKDYRVVVYCGYEGYSKSNRKQNRKRHRVV